MPADNETSRYQLRKALMDQALMDREREWTTNPTQRQRQALDTLQAIYRAGHKDETSVPHPSMFQADPLVIGGGDQFAREARRLLDLDPVTKGRTGTITYGPTRRSMLEGETAVGLDGQPHRVMGEVDDQHNIGIHGDEEEFSPAVGTLAHEIAHVAGHDETGAYPAGFVAQEGLQSDAAALRNLMAAKARTRAREAPQTPERMAKERTFRDAIELERQRADMTMRRGPNLVPRMPRGGR